MNVATAMVVCWRSQSADAKYMKSRILRGSVVVPWLNISSCVDTQQLMSILTFRHMQGCLKFSERQLQQQFLPNQCSSGTRTEGNSSAIHETSVIHNERLVRLLAQLSQTLQEVEAISLFGI